MRSRTYGLMTAVLTSSLATAAYADNSEISEDRPYKSENQALDSVLQRYWDSTPRVKCDKGEELSVVYKGNRFDISVEEVCLGGGTVYQLKIVWNYKKNSETFVDSNLDGKLDDSPIFMTMPDLYTLRYRKGTVTVNFTDYSKKDWKTLRKHHKLTSTKINANYSASLKMIQKAPASPKYVPKAKKKQKQRKTPLRSGKKTERFKKGKRFTGAVS